MTPLGRRAAPPAGDVVEVWLIRTDQPPSCGAGLDQLLDAAERQRAAELRREQASARFVVAHAAARMIIGAGLGLRPADLCWRYGAHGKPELAPPADGMQVSLSRSGALAALALCPGRAVGVDIQELVDGLDVARMSARYFLPDEARFVSSASEPGLRLRRFVRLWVRKEACLKVAGDRLVPGLKLAVRAGRLVTGEPGPLAGPFSVRDIAAPGRFGAAVAAAGPEPYQVLRRWWPDNEPG